MIFSAEIGIRLWSDHVPVLTEFDPPSTSKKTSQWVFNKSLLFKESITQELRQNLSNYFKENSMGEVAPEIIWDAMKAVLREQLIVIGSRGKKTTAC